MGKMKITQLERDNIFAICKPFRMGKRRITIHDDGTVDVCGNVWLMNKSLTKLPVKFGVITGDFRCEHNQLTTLDGSPSIVYGDFLCGYNQLSSLKYAPSIVGRSFGCENNQLTSLEHCPNEVFSFTCQFNKLTSLEHSPKIVPYKFVCCDNMLTSLEGAPNKVGYFICGRNQLTSLAYSPAITNPNGWFACDQNSFSTPFNDLSYDQIKTFIKYHSYYDVWAPDFNKENFDMLIEEINDGLR